jgi:hypothetical protein
LRDCYHLTRERRSPLSPVPGAPDRGAGAYTLGKLGLKSTACNAKTSIQALHTGYDILAKAFHLVLFIENGV